MTVEVGNRPQEVTFDSDGYSLAGTFVPVADPVAEALLIVGSGRTDRNSDVRLPAGQRLRSGITRAVAEALAAVGVPTLRYDKRGVGASGGDYLTTGMPQRLADAQAALGWLSARSTGLPLLVVGHSEGTYYAAQLAAADKDVAGAVLLSGSVRTGAEINAWQVEQLADKLPPAARLILRLMRTDVVKSQRKNQAKIMASSADVIRVQGVRINAGWVRDFIRYDPAGALTRVTVPVLAITGGHDLQVPPADVESVGKLVHGPFEGHVVGDLNHMLRPDPDCVGPRGYRRAARQPVSPQVLDLIKAWVQRHWGPA
jgi:pimeloyl-ACP methyl ester carboxylesterase